MYLNIIFWATFKLHPKFVWPIIRFQKLIKLFKNTEKSSGNKGWLKIKKFTFERYVKSTKICS